MDGIVLLLILHHHLQVRYQSRKKLAEQRPRIRGQFVRQAANGIKDKDAFS